MNKSRHSTKSQTTILLSSSKLFSQVAPALLESLASELKLVQLSCRIAAPYIYQQYAVAADGLVHNFRSVSLNGADAWGGSRAESLATQTHRAEQTPCLAL